MVLRDAFLTFFRDTAGELYRHALLKLDLALFLMFFQWCRDWRYRRRKVSLDQSSPAFNSKHLVRPNNSHKDCSSVNVNSGSQLFCWLFLFEAFAISYISPAWGRPFQRPWLDAVVWSSEEWGSSLQMSWVPHSCMCYVICLSSICIVSVHSSPVMTHFALCKGSILGSSYETANLC